MVTILGRSFVSALERETLADVVSLAHKMKEGGPAKDSEVKVKLFLLFRNVDKQIIDKLLKDVSEWVLLFYSTSLPKYFHLKSFNHS